MRFATLSRLATFLAAIAVSPAIAQAEGDHVSAPSYRSLMPLQIDIDRFELVGSSEFGVGMDENGSVEGWQDRNFDTVVLMPIDNLAACSGLTLTYTSGETEDYPLLSPGLLSHKQIYQLFPRGELGEVQSIEASCHALSGDGVTIGFYGASGDLFAAAS